MLKAYQLALWIGNGGYLPEQIDRFLCSRLQTSLSEAELHSIAGFYVRQARGREFSRPNRPLLMLSGRAQGRFVGAVMAQLSEYDAHLTHNALLLLEEIRQGKEIWKGSFFDVAGTPVENTAEELEARWQSTTSKVKTRYVAWWRQDKPWSAKCAEDPMAGTSIVAHEL